MDNKLLTDDELAKMRLNAVSCTVFEKERLLAHIAALQSDLELLIKVSCREQRYKCADAVEDVNSNPARAQNARCPDIADVLHKWENAKGENE